METLIKMTDYLPDNPYSKFLKQTPQLWMFVPCKLVDGVWFVLEEINEDYPNNIEYFEEIEEYQQAKERCYFEGFELRCPNSVTNGNISITFTKSGGILLDKVCDNYFENIGTITSIEQLTDYNLTLTATAQKEIV